MLKLLLSILLGCFCIYGFDRLGFISLDDIEAPAYTEKYDVGDPEKEDKIEKKAPLRFTDRIATKNQ